MCGRGVHGRGPRKPAVKFLFRLFLGLQLVFSLSASTVVPFRTAAVSPVETEEAPAKESSSSGSSVEIAAAQRRSELPAATHQRPLKLADTRRAARAAATTQVECRHPASGHRLANGLTAPLLS